MLAGKRQSDFFADISFYLLAVLLLLVPLVFTTSLENGFTLTKAAALSLLGGLFIITAVIVLLKRTLRNDENSDVIVIEKKTDLAVIFFLAAAAISAIFSIRLQISLYGQLERQIGLFVYIDLALIYFFSAQILDSQKKIRTLFLLMEITGVVVSLYGLTQFLMIDPFGLEIVHTRPVSTLGHGIFMAGFLIMVYPVSLAAALEKSKPYLRFLSPLVITFGIVAAQSRIVYVAWIVVTCMVVIMYKQIAQGFSRKKFIIRLMIILALFAAGILFVTLIFPENIYVKRFHSISRFFDSSRYLIWHDSLKVFVQYPFFGSGIETFSYVFENVISPQLRLMEIDRFFDNAHSNYIQTLCTMGAVGFAAYLSLLFIPVMLSVKIVSSKNLSNESRKLALPLLGSFIAYIIYGTADFDNNVILLYFFVNAAILKSLYAKELKLKGYPAGSIAKAIAVITACIVVSFAGFNIYRYYNEVLADSYYQTGKKYYGDGNFKESVETLNKSVVLNSRCPDYKFTLATYVYDFAANNTALSAESKLKLLKQSEEELVRAEVNFPSVLQCKALRAVIFLEEGREQESEQLVSEVFRADTYMITLRNNLASYYLRKHDYTKMKEQLELVDTYDPLNVTAESISLSYYLQINDKPNAITSCEKILKMEPDNIKVKLKLEELKK